MPKRRDRPVTGKASLLVFWRYAGQNLAGASFCRPLYHLARSLTSRLASWFLCHGGDRALANLGESLQKPDPLISILYPCAALLYPLVAPCTAPVPSRMYRFSPKRNLPTIGTAIAPRRLYVARLTAIDCQTHDIQPRQTNRFNLM